MNLCTLCPRACRVDRSAGQQGFCRSGELPRVARSELHFWEEPCISGKRGSGAVFFTGCNLRCSFCQNAVISRDGERGQLCTPRQLAGLFLKLQEKGAHNINLVTGSHYWPKIIEALEIAKAEGLSLPVVWNCGGYETAEAIDALAPYVSVWLPDDKFFSPALAKEVCAAGDYPEVCGRAIEKMVACQPEPCFDADGMMTKGVIVRHLPLPSKLFDSKKIIDSLHSRFGDQIWLSLLNQYTPMESCPIAWLRRPLPAGHYDALVNHCIDLGMTQVYVQEASACGEEFIPRFYDLLPDSSV